jgi:predicted DNA-binding transcriptional regulator AlpA
MTGLAGGTIRNRAHLGTFPAARPHADGGVRWQLGEVRQWLARRDQAHSKSEYKRRVSMGDTRVLPPQSKADPEGSAQTGPGRGLEGP